MNQVNFLWLSKNIPGISVRQEPKGVTVVKLRPLIEITHDSTRMNRLEILFKDDGSKYVIPNQTILEEIYRMHMANTELMLLLHQYCDNKHLDKC